MKNGQGKLAVVTGASSGIGLELAKLCAADGYSVIAVADEPEIRDAAREIGAGSAAVEPFEADLATIEGVDRLYAAIGGRPVDVLIANAGCGVGGGFLDQDFETVRHVIDTNITGTIYLVQRVGRDMVARGQGRVMFTGSIAGYSPGPFQAVYNATKAFIDSFSIALRNEIQDSGVTVTCLMPGATETEFFERADMTDTRIAQSKKDDPADVAEKGYKAMLAGEAQVVTGLMNKIMTTIANVTPATISAQQHRKLSEPGSGE